ncbi:hypothetical protein EC973_002166 [Apophysomyces ossiformis]|uniref:Uncharacterized protein n=1 Tax=Apophysomyces ossiformis TaxID=679940 RepID=A0A8H7EN19_9FUNG|nr:hypothetical protein EC973_002166 [Apophysomyces ossiformis]
MVWVRVNTYGIAIWRCGIIVLVFLIDNPRSGRLHLTSEQETIVEDRIRDNVVKRTAIYKTKHVMESLKELRYWALMMATCMITFESGMKLYESQITRSFGFTTFQSLLLSALVGLAECGYNLVGAYTARKTNQTMYTITCLAAIGAVGIGLMISPLPAAGKLVGQIIQTTGPSVHIMVYLVVANNVSGYTKKIFYCGSVTACVTVGHVTGQFAMAPQFAPQYTFGIVINLICKLLAACCLLLARWPMAKANRERRSLLMTNEEKANYVVEDVTDVQDRRFIYRL